MKKFNIILDIDETMVSAKTKTEIGKNKSRLKKFVHHEDMPSYVIVERPGLQDFLTFVFDKFNVSIWTAGSKEYATDIVKNVMLKNHPERHLEWLFFKYHGVKSKQAKNASKSLDMLFDVYKLPGYNKDNTLIIDDNEEVKKTQLDNCLQVRVFDYNQKNSEKDTVLTEVKTKLENMRTVKDAV